MICFASLFLVVEMGERPNDDDKASKEYEKTNGIVSRTDEELAEDRRVLCFYFQNGNKSKSYAQTRHKKPWPYI